jgi:uncharacterized integral membrane protein
MTTEPQPPPAAAPAPGPATGAGVPPQTGPATQPPPQTGPATQPPPQTAPQQATAPSAAPPLKIKRTRTSGLWVTMGCFAVLLLLLLIFILQNSAKVNISFMGAHGHLPLGVALLFAAVCGVLLVVLAGAARIGQLRTVARRHRRADAKARG